MTRYRVESLAITQVLGRLVWEGEGRCQPPSQLSSRGLVTKTACNHLILSDGLTVGPGRNPGVDAGRLDGREAGRLDMALW